MSLPATRRECEAVPHIVVRRTLAPYHQPLRLSRAERNVPPGLRGSRHCVALVDDSFNVPEAASRVRNTAFGCSPTLHFTYAQVLALRALTGMAAVLAQRVCGVSSLAADLAALETGDLPPDQRAATMLIANKKRVLGAAAQALAAALKVLLAVNQCALKSAGH